MYDLQSDSASAPADRPRTWDDACLIGPARQAGRPSGKQACRLIAPVGEWTFSFVRAECAVEKCVQLETDLKIEMSTKTVESHTAFPIDENECGRTPHPERPHRLRQSLRLYPPIDSNWKLDAFTTATEARSTSHRVHRTPGRGRHRALGGHRRGQVRQRPR